MMLSLPVIISYSTNSFPLMSGVALLLMGILFALVGYGVRTFKSWARNWSAILFGLGMAGVPIGTLLGIYVLYLMLSKKGHVVFSEDYQKIIAATPHIQCPVPIVMWLFFAVLMLVVVLAIIAKMIRFASQ